jgi:hypothetical protein
MIWVDAALTLAVAVLALFVLGLLRSHAELLRRITELAGRPTADAANGSGSRLETMPEGVLPVPDEVARTPVSKIGGVDCDLRPYEQRLRDLREQYLLVAFLSTTCLSCLEIWRDIIEAGAEAAPIEAGDDAAALLLVLKGREEENLGKARALAVDTPVPVILSAEAWAELEVPGSPYFALIDVSGERVMGAGSAQSWEQLKSLASDAMLELSLATAPPRRSGNGRGGGYRSIIEREDEDLRRAGLHPGDPSLTGPVHLDAPEGTPSPNTYASEGDGAP